MTALIIVNDSYKLKQQCDTPLFSISEEDALFIKKGYENKPRYKYIFAEKYGYTKDGSVTVDTAGPQDQPFIPPFYPDILAPSYDVYTTTVYEKRGEPHFSDISAAVAYVAGATALIVELNRNRLIGIGYIKAALQNSAVPVKDRGVDYYAPALYQGAGMINLNKLIDARSIRAEPSSVNMGYTYAKVANVPIKISSLSATSLSYSFLHIPTAAVPRLPHTIDMSLRSSVIAEVFFPESIELQPHQISEIVIKISTPTNILKHEIWSYSGYVVIDPNLGVNGSPSEHAVFVPYEGTVKG
ncbi:hypothetical protein BDF19DRAFT_316072 [Syncephalis fuscata]|nr:hypothetical protein BDF19DRAFT_316072 [Syncephalis fuscata]